MQDDKRRGELQNIKYRILGRVDETIDFFVYRLNRALEHRNWMKLSKDIEFKILTIVRQIAYRWPYSVESGDLNNVELWGQLKFDIVEYVRERSITPEVYGDWISRFAFWSQLNAYVFELQAKIRRYARLKGRIDLQLKKLNDSIVSVIGDQGGEDHLQDLMTVSGRLGEIISAIDNLETRSVLSGEVGHFIDSIRVDIVFGTLFEKGGRVTSIKQCVSNFLSRMVNACYNVANTCTIYGEDFAPDPIRRALLNEESRRIYEESRPGLVKVWEAYVMVKRVFEQDVGTNKEKKI